MSATGRAVPNLPQIRRAPGVSVRLKLTFSYAGFLMLSGALLLGVVWVFLLRYVPDGAIPVLGRFVPNRSDLWRAFAPAAAWAMLFLLGISLLGGWILAGRMLRPLSRITGAARKAALGSLSHRITLEGRRDEFRDLADAFDTMLARVEAHVAEQQRFAANASHELRTPLTISQTLLEVARNDPDRDTDAVLERLHSVNARAIDLTEALLLLSRADQGTLVRETVDLSLVVEEAAETLLPLAEKRGIDVRVTGDVARTVGSRALLTQMVTNLLHNALVHNLPSRGVVTVRTAAGPDVVVLMVENTGERLSAELVSTLTEPFRRGAERVRSHDSGVGLGLAIVERIVRAHSGQLRLEPCESGGLRVSVELGVRAAPETRR